MQEVRCEGVEEWGCLSRRAGEKVFAGFSGVVERFLSMKERASVEGWRETGKGWRCGRVWERHGRIRKGD